VIPEPAVVDADYSIPERSGDTLFVPPAERLPSLLIPYEPPAAAAILDVPLREFRRRTRERVRSLIAAAAAGPRQGTARRAADVPEIPSEWRSSTDARPLVVMGHQPVFFHPGVWLKYFLLGKLCAATGALGLHCSVDSDAVGPVSASIPTGRDGAGRTTRTLVTLPSDVPLESAPVPGDGAWAAFESAVRDDLRGLGMPDLMDRFGAFADGDAEARREALTLAAYLDGLRGVYERRTGVPRYADVGVSALASTPEFHAFALHLVQDPPALRAAYNGALDAHRRAHRIRSAANPFPNLIEADGRVETPFWALVDGRRRDLFAARDGARLVLGTGTQRLATVPLGPAGVGALAASGVALRPKALTLTMFARVCLGDLFIHGAGGGRYDRVTDVLTQELLDVRPAPYAVATATLHLPLGHGRDIGAHRHALERRLMDLRHNPDRHLAAPGETEQRLIDEKWALIRAVEAMRPGRERRAATRRIRDVNGLLAERLAPEIARVESELAALSAEPPADDAAEFRGYPFFLFEPRDVAALVPEIPRA
jgi:hypothetical protein